MSEIKFADQQTFSRHLLVSTCVNCEGKGFEWKRSTGWVADRNGNPNTWQCCWMCEGYGTTFSGEKVRELLGHQHLKAPKR